MRYSTPTLFLLAVLVIAGCDSANDADPIDRSIAQYPTGVVGKDIFYSTMWRGFSLPWLGGIYSLNYDGSGHALLYKNAILYSAPRDSQLVFSSDKTVYLGNTKGSSLQKLFTSPDDIVYAILSPDAKKVLYATRGWVDSLNIYDLNSHTSLPIIVPDFLVLSGDYPVFSDDSRKILFTQENNSERATNLFLIDADGTNKQVVDTAADYQFLNSMGDFLYQTVDFSPDGSKCCYIQVGKKKSYLVIKDIGTGVTEVVDSTIPGGQRWSPLGNYLYYKHGDYDNEDSSVIYDVHTKQRSIYGITGIYPEGNIGAYDWSADETKLIVQLSFGTFEEPSHTLALMNASTGAIEKQYNLRNMMACYRARARGEH